MNMFNKITLLCLLVMLCLAVVTPALADGPAIGSPQDNACNGGGAMNPHCTTHWHWVCGYYIARFNDPLANANHIAGWGAGPADYYSVSQPYFNDDCASLYPDRPASE
jgi:hypothetical protein